MEQVDDPEATLRGHRVIPRPGRSDPRWVPLTAAGYLLIALIAVLLVDIARVIDLQTGLTNHSGQPLLWYALFMEHGPTEILQWILLLTMAFVAGRLAMRLHGTPHAHAAWFWALLALTGVILTIEDALTLRHHLAHFVMGIVGVEGRHPVRTATELTYYALIASIPAYAAVRYWPVFWHSPSRIYLLTGFAVYATAAIASASRDIGHWYVTTGTWLDAATGGRLGAGFIQTLPDRPVGFYIVDFIFEESLELMAGAFLLAAAVAYTRHKRTLHLRADDNESDPGTSDAPKRD